MSPVAMCPFQGQNQISDRFVGMLPTLLYLSPLGTMSFGHFDRRVSPDAIAFVPVGDGLFWLREQLRGLRETLRHLHYRLLKVRV